ncbi:MAG: hypothetical protein HN380_31945, partial [Victivallales bacterium]|nr:hypothetical protein [Victivallales bacterium]
CLAREPQAPAETIRQIAEYMRENGDVQKRWRRATREARLRERVAQVKAHVRQRPYTPEQMERLKQQLADRESRLDEAQGKLAVAGIENPEERQAKLKELEVEAAAAQKAFQDAVAPLNKEREGRRREHALLEELLDALLEPVALTAPDLGVTRANTSTQPESGSAALGWHDAEGKTVALLHLSFLRSHRSTRAVTKLAGKYPVHQLSGGSMDFSVGTVSASFSCKAEWRNQQGMKKVVLALVNFDALADLGAALEEDGDLKQRLTDCMEKGREWQTRRQKATQSPGSWRSRVSGKMDELRLPYDTTRLELLDNQIASNELDVASTRAELSMAMIEDPEKHKSERAKAAKEAKQARRETQAAKAPLRPELVAMERKARYVKFAAWEMVDAVVRTPKDTGIIEAKIQEAFALGSMGIHFNDVHTEQLVFALLCFRPMAENTNAPIKLAGKYPAKMNGSVGMSIWVGGATVTLNVQKAEWQNRAKIVELATSLLDLDAIAA